MNPTDNYIENFLNIKDPSLNFVDCSRTTYKGKKVIMCTAIAELDTCPNCESADSFVYNGFNANFPGFYNSMSKKPTITAFFEV